MQLRGSTVRRPSCEGRTLNAFLGCAFSRDEAEADELDVLILLGPASGDASSALPD